MPTGDCLTNKSKIVNGQENAAIPLIRARPDLAFCLPLQVQLDHRDYACLLYSALHGIGLWIVVACLPVVVALPLLLTACCSLRHAWGQQAVLFGYRALVCDRTGQWYLLGDDQRRQWIALDQLQMPGPLLLIRLRHFGGSVFWITFRHQQAASQWGRLRALCRLV